MIIKDALEVVLQLAIDNQLDLYEAKKNNMENIFEAEQKALSIASDFIKGLDDEITDY